jgi:hypothetical protein
VTGTSWDLRIQLRLRQDRDNKGDEHVVELHFPRLTTVSDVEEALQRVGAVARSLPNKDR